jgi:hypothetical protein
MTVTPGANTLSPYIGPQNVAISHAIAFIHHYSNCNLYRICLSRARETEWSHSSKEGQTEHWPGIGALAKRNHCKQQKRGINCRQEFWGVLEAGKYLWYGSPFYSKIWIFLSFHGTLLKPTECPHILGVKTQLLQMKIMAYIVFNLCSTQFQTYIQTY